MSNALGIKPGDLIQNTYRIEELLGEGGMGATFKGRNETTGHDVAIKVMIPSFASDNRAVDLFKRESSLLRTVQNDAVIRYETTLQDSEGRLFLVMEYVSGKPLAYYIKKGARLDSGDVLKLAGRLAGGLHAIHKLNIVHRDIAPDNILVPDDDILHAKFIDFGLASDTVGTEKSIIGNSVAGKFSYMAPEQLGLFGAKATSATDIYALGLVLLQVAGEKVPGSGMGIGAIEARREDLTLGDTKLSPALRGLLESMLRADPKDRVVDLNAAINTAMTAPMGSPKKGRPSKTESGAQTSKTSSKGPLMAILGVLAAVVIGAGAYFMMQSEPKAVPPLSIEKALALLKTDDPIDGARRLVEIGGQGNLETVLGALSKLGNDKSMDADKRIPALIMVAQMYDPETYDPATSPFPQANVGAARRAYQKAADLGSEAAQNALARLGE